MCVPSCRVTACLYGDLMSFGDSMDVSDSSPLKSLLDSYQKKTRNLSIFVSKDIMLVCPEVMGDNPCL
jgi:hypothetical protein